jgi:hypothetical protein
MDMFGAAADWCEVYVAYAMALVLEMKVDRL